MTVRVLVVDDSAFARKVLREVLEGDPELEVVGFARDGLDALEKIVELKPDVVTLDLVMPNLDGLGVLRALPVGGGSPRVVVVSIADESSALGVQALQAGAIDLVHKPTALATALLYELGEELRRKIKIAAIARVSIRTSSVARPQPIAHRTTGRRIVVIGASTGGPHAVTRLLHDLPANFPVPIAVVLHMPVEYTRPFAERLDEECALEVREVDDGMVLRPGLVAIARGGKHLWLDDRDGALGVRSSYEPLDLLHRPAVDVLFRSAAALGSQVLGVVLTGMGDDGLAGAREIVAAGGEVLTESEASCVIYGMPRVIKEAGLSSAEASIEGMAALLLSRV